MHNNSYKRIDGFDGDARTGSPLGAFCTILIQRSIKSSDYVLIATEFRAK